MKKNNKGFSLVELIVVIAIMAILAAVAIPTFAHFITKANEASDAELLNNINYFFNLACVENGVDVKDVTAAEWDKTNKCVINVKVNGADNDDIEASFVLHFGEMKNENFILIEDIVFDAAKHEFVDLANAGSLTITYGGGTITLDASDIAALKGSTFGEMGIAPLLGQLDQVTDIAASLDNALLNDILDSDDFKKSAAQALGINVEDEDWATQYSNKVTQLLSDYLAPKTIADATQPEIDAAMAKIEANAAVLYAANQTTKVMTPTDIDNFMKTPSKQTIIDNMDPNKTADPSLGLAQASLMCGLYTSYVNSSYGAELTDDEKEVNVANVLAAMETEAFQNYLKSPQGQKDKDGYLSSLNMISGSAQNPDAVSQLMINGFGDPALVGSLNGAIGQ